VKKTLIALTGVANTGKTTTIKMVFDLLASRYKHHWICEKRYKHDITAILTIESKGKRTRIRKKIGIESQGDPGSRLQRSLRSFIKLNCKVIVCARRSQRRTFDDVEKLAFNHRYQVKSFYQTKSSRNHLSNNTRMAVQIFSEVKRALAL